METLRDKYFNETGCTSCQSDEAYINWLESKLSIPQGGEAKITEDELVQYLVEMDIEGYTEEEKAIWLLKKLSPSTKKFPQGGGVEEEDLIDTIRNIIPSHPIQYKTIELQNKAWREYTEELAKAILSKITTPPQESPSTQWDKLLSDFLEWQDKTFPEQTAVGKLNHLKKEVVELIEAIKAEDIDNIREEFADCFMLLYASLDKFGWRESDMHKAFKEKFEIVKKRKNWKPNPDGSFQHIEESPSTGQAEGGEKVIGTDCAGQEIIPIGKLSIHVNRHPNINGTSWGWIDGCTKNIVWSDDKKFNHRAASDLVEAWNKTLSPAPTKDETFCSLCIHYIDNPRENGAQSRCDYYKDVCSAVNNGGHCWRFKHAKDEAAQGVDEETLTKLAEKSVYEDYGLTDEDSEQLSAVGSFKAGFKAAMSSKGEVDWKKLFEDFMAEFAYHYNFPGQPHIILPYESEIVFEWFKTEIEKQLK